MLSEGTSLACVEPIDMRMMSQCVVEDWVNSNYLSLNQMQIYGGVTQEAPDSLKFGGSETEKVSISAFYFLVTCHLVSILRQPAQKLGNNWTPLQKVQQCQ